MLWIQNPKILIDADQAYEVFPIYNKGCGDSMLNSIARLLMLLAIFVMLFKRESLTALLMVFIGFIFLTIALGDRYEDYQKEKFHKSPEENVVEVACSQKESQVAPNGISNSLAKALRGIRDYSRNSAFEPDYIDSQINRSTGAYRHEIASKNVTDDGLQYGVAFNRGKYIRNKRFLDNFS